MANDVKINIGARDNASRILRGVTGNVQTLGATSAKVMRGLTIGATAVAGAFAGIGTATIALLDTWSEAGDALDKLSARTGLSVEFLSQLGFAAEQTGTSIEQMGQALFRGFRRIGNAISGTGPAVRALEELNLSAEELAQLSPEDIFFRLTDALNAVENPLRRSQLGFEIFGDNWRQIVPLLNAGTNEIRNLMRELDELGGTMTGEQAAAAAQYRDAINSLTKSWEGLRNQVAFFIADDVTQVLDGLTLAIKNLDTVVNAAEVSFINLDLAVSGFWQGINQMSPIQIAGFEESMDTRIAELKDARAQAIADALTGPLQREIAATTRSMFERGKAEGEAYAEGVEHGVNKADIEPIKLDFQMPEMPTMFRTPPAIQATEGRLLTGRPAAKHQAQQQQEFRQMKKELEQINEKLAEPGGLPVREVGPEKDTLEVELVN